MITAIDLGKGPACAGPFWRASLDGMTPEDFTTLAAFLYGPQWRGALSDDTRVRSDNLGRLTNGRRPIPPPLAAFLLRRASDRWMLRGWQDQAPPAGLSPATAAELARLIEAARRSTEPNEPADPRGGGLDQ